MTFTDRNDAGRRLAPLVGSAIADSKRVADPSLEWVIAALPRGGVPVGFTVADSLGLPLDVIIVRKLGVPSHPELAMGAIGEGGCRVLNRDVIDHVGVALDELASVEAAERIELERRADEYRRGRPPTPLDGRGVVIVDDGVATGATAAAACQVAAAAGARRVVLAVPVAATDVFTRFAELADSVVVVETHRMFGSVGQYYADFTQTTDRQVIEQLARAR